LIQTHARVRISVTQLDDVLDAATTIGIASLSTGTIIEATAGFAFSGTCRWRAVFVERTITIAISTTAVIGSSHGLARLTCVRDLSI
jgi:hypothetical protein